MEKFKILRVDTYRDGGTVSEVGAIYSLLIFIAGFLIYNLFDSIVEMVSDFRKWLR